MYHTEASLLIHRPLTDVFAMVSDLNHHTEWQDNLIEARWTSVGALGVGSTYNFVTQFVGSRMDLPGKISVWDPPHGWQWQATGGPFPVQGGYRLEPLGMGTRVTMFSDSEPSGWMNMMRPLLKWLGERSYRRSLTRLKAKLEEKENI